MSIDKELWDTLDAIYAATGNSMLWPQVIERVMRIVESQAASFCVIDSSDTPSMPLFHYINAEKRLIDYDRFMHEYLVDGIASKDPTLRYIVDHPHQQLVLDSNILSESEKDRHEYYAWHGSHSDTRHRMAGMIKSGSHLQSGITLHRTYQFGKFEDELISRFNFLLPHLQRAVLLSFQLGTLSAFRTASIELFDSNSRGILLLDRKCRVLFANKAASELAERADGLTLSVAGLTLSNADDQRRLDQLVANALTNTRPDEGMMLAHRPSGKRPLFVLVSHLALTEGTLADAPAICITVSDPDVASSLPERPLRDLFGLTRSESRLAIALARGISIAQAADELGRTYGTARAQLAAIFRKTGTNRQSELIQLLLASIPKPLLRR